ncbi:cytochrome c oxidase assembly factor [Strigomonas culicis]|uniref:Cytochrome c oxidase assembly factor n=1 Tax=Strigomonas culicis TaxID=28005 RepID=S9UIB7_9TRYP|nr:cytochrome c oxidase assembly factor [Strigomonas culicis]|eukprot:EPY30557.1 cytochrome c oxidase assembly factor [Strigomonas culicis]
MIKHLSSLHLSPGGGRLVVRLRASVAEAVDVVVVHADTIERVLQTHLAEEEVLHFTVRPDEIDGAAVVKLERVVDRLGRVDALRLPRQALLFCLVHGGEVDAPDARGLLHRVLAAAQPADARGVGLRLAIALEEGVQHRRRVADVVNADKDRLQLRLLRGGVGARRGRLSDRLLVLLLRDVEGRRAVDARVAVRDVACIHQLREEAQRVRAHLRALGEAEVEQRPAVGKDVRVGGRPPGGALEQLERPAQLLLGCHVHLQPAVLAGGREVGGELRWVLQQALVLAVLHVRGGDREHGGAQDEAVQLRARAWGPLTPPLLLPVIIIVIIIIIIIIVVVAVVVRLSFRLRGRSGTHGRVQRGAVCHSGRCGKAPQVRGVRQMEELGSF